jgi:hypothetical protein
VTSTIQIAKKARMKLKKRKKVRKQKQKQKRGSGALVAHACNPSYSGGTDQEDRSLKPAQANSHETLSRKIHHTKKMGWWSSSM